LKLMECTIFCEIAGVEKEVAVWEEGLFVMGI
jgi:hypothetical protein